MKKFFDVIRRSPKRTAAVAVVAAAVAVPIAANAWGPSDRPTFTYDKPASYVTFNSMTNTPNYGDERNFVRVKESGAANNTYTDNFDLVPGKKYTVMMYYHNNAASNLNDDAHGRKGIAQNATARFAMPAAVKKGESARLNGFISASNAKPQMVWDEAYGKASHGDVALRYVRGTAKIFSNGAVNGQALSDNLFKNGTPLGYDKLDGNLPGCNQYAGYITFEFTVDQPNFNINKTVSKAGENKFAEDIAVNPNDEVEYKIEYRNTGTVQQNNVVLSDQLPKGVQYVAGSTKLASSKTGGKLTAVNENSLVNGGLNLGSFAPNSNAFVTFRAKVVDNNALDACGVNTLTNIAKVSTDNGQKQDTAVVTVTKKCDQPAPKKIKVCDLTTKKIVEINEKDFDSKKHSKNEKDCAQQPAKKQIEVCDLTTKKVVTIDESAFDSKKHSKNLADCKTNPTVPPTPPVTPPTPGQPTEKKVQVCDKTTGQIVSLNEKNVDSSKHTTDTAACNPTPTTPVNPAPPAPKNPDALPQTGAVGLAGVGIGASALTAAALYAVTRKKN